jgi:hypothetical protein
MPNVATGSVAVMPPAGPYRIGGLERLPLCDGTHWYVGFRDPRN